MTQHDYSSLDFTGMTPDQIKQAKKKFRRQARKGTPTDHHIRQQVESLPEELRDEATEILNDAYDEMEGAEIDFATAQVSDTKRNLRLASDFLSEDQIDELAAALKPHSRKASSATITITVSQDLADALNMILPELPA